MKSLKYYLSLPYPTEIIPDSEEGGFTIFYPDLPGCLTCGETVEKAKKNAEDAKRVWLEAALDEGIEIQEPNIVCNSSGEFKHKISPKQQRKPSIKKRILV